MNEIKKQQRKFLSFLSVGELKFWYFKYIIGMMLFAIIVAGITIHFALSHSAQIIKFLAKQSELTSVSLSLDTIVEILRSTQIIVRNALIVESIVLIIIGIFISLYFVHKIIGALKRIDREVTQMLTGTTPYHEITLRKGDYLKPFVEIMNRLINKISKS